ncbi:MAG: HesA/MoeB/ThiF family protein [Helicobacteraceae bacterium]|jgi:molybdopterin/thiamine biosynthesis adenylyltransferase|nr:HesA/MoeB/ThiF family protein [Helicobacteraceae bacterium]
MREWTDAELERYSRHIILEDVGIEGQEKILNAKVLVIGAGGLGSPIALYLAAAGVGEIGIADGDLVDLSNLQRQIIHATPDVGAPKVESAKAKMLAINPAIKVNVYQEFLSAENILRIVKPYDFVIDGTDNFAAKFLINDACVLAKKPYSHGGILRFAGQTMTIKPRESACYACAFNAPPPAGAVPTCSSAGILGAVAGMLGAIQAAETLKFITGAGELLTNSLLSFDAKTMNFRKIKLAKNPHCRVCGGSGVTSLTDYEQQICEVKK